jgi:hypothetical protein
MATLHLVLDSIQGFFKFYYEVHLRRPNRALASSLERAFTRRAFTDGYICGERRWTVRGVLCGSMWDGQLVGVLAGPWGSLWVGEWDGQWAWVLDCPWNSLWVEVWGGQLGSLWVELVDGKSVEVLEGLGASLCAEVLDGEWVSPWGEVLENLRAS